jgi:hypothetical protein
MTKTDVVKAAIEFRDPPYIPMECVEVPGVYDAYGNLDPFQVRLLPGTEDFDSVQATYHWSLTDVGSNQAGERVRRDEWGCVQRVPEDSDTAYEIIHKPMAEAIPDPDKYPWPDISVTDPFFRRMAQALPRYHDRFICGYIDPGPFLIAFNLMSYDGLLVKLYDDLDRVKAVFDRILDFHLKLVKRWKKAGAHMVQYIDEFAGKNGLMLRPDIWRQHFAAYFERFIAAVHDEGLYAGCCLDGDVRAVLPDIKALGLDVLDIRQLNCMGLDAISALCGGLCVKTSIDMMTTLARGTPEEVDAEARALCERLGGRGGGYICMTLKWHRPEYPPQNVRASVESFNRYRFRG